MFRNYLRLAWRNLWKHKLFSAINAVGLALGVACTLLISLWVHDERGFDQFLPNASRVFRIESTTTTPNGAQSQLPAVGWPVGRILQKEFPEVEQLTYVKGWNPQIKHRGAYVKEKALQADEHFLGVLGYELAQGNPKTALNEPFTVVISPEAEEKYFGKGNALGKVLMVNDTLPHRVTGVFKTVPRNGHLQFSMVRSIASLYTLFPQDMTYEFASGWFDLNVYNYVLLKPGVNTDAFAAKISGLVGQRGRDMVKQTGMNATLALRPVGDVYLRSKMPTENGPVGDIDTLYLFMVIGGFILLIACLNVINLTTARATNRAKEVGVRKVLGVHKSQLVWQFLTEAALVCTTATALGLLMVGAALPFFRSFTGKSMPITELLTLDNLVLLGGFLVVLVLFTGFYPAWILTRYQPITVLKGAGGPAGMAQSFGGTLLRKGLVVMQFTVSVGLTVCTVAAWQQVQFMRQQPLGFDSHNVVLVDLKDVSSRTRYQQAQTLRDELLQQSQIRRATTCVAVPGQVGWDGQFAYGEGNTVGKGILVEHIPVGQTYTQTLHLSLLSGRDFVADSKADEQQSFLINEAAVKAFGWANPQVAVGRKLSVSGVNGQVVGVLRNYHQHGLQGTIRPVVLNIMPIANLIAFRYEGTNPTVVISQLKAAWAKLFAGYPLTYRFLDEAFQQQYEAEQKLIQTFSIAAGLAILIACLGLFGLATFSAEQRRKEIGVRKVLGASVASIVTLLSKDFLKLVFIAIIVASPLAWYAMHRWLQGFAYKLDINWWIFALAGTLAVGIALLTVSFQSIKAALMNPVKSLRSE